MFHRERAENVTFVMAGNDRGHYCRQIFFGKIKKNKEPGSQDFPTGDCLRCWGVRVYRKECLEMAKKVVEIENLVKRYKDLIALDHLNLAIEEGEVFGLLGPNGSGKTTAINCILALLHFDKGSVKVFGEEMPVSEFAKKHDQPRTTVSSKKMVVLGKLRAFFRERGLDV